MQQSPNLLTSLFLTYDPNSPDVIGEPPNYNEYESRVNKFEEIKRRLRNTGKAMIQHFEWNDAISELLHFFQVVEKH